MLAWVGAEIDAPSCLASGLVENGTMSVSDYADPNGPSACSACTCTPPTGSCLLQSYITASAATCGGDGGPAQSSFDPPNSWDGSCTSVNAIPAGQLCGGVPCVQSVKIGPLTIKQTGCQPSGVPTLHPPRPGTKIVRTCYGQEDTSTCKLGEICAPVRKEIAFNQCIFRWSDPADATCPAGYPDRRVFYDENPCLPCKCDAPTGSDCVGLISVFGDGACSVPLFSTQHDTTGPTCHDVPPGSALGSKTWTDTTYSPGTCAPSGGKLVNLVFCCQS